MQQRWDHSAVHRELASCSVLQKRYLHQRIVDRAPLRSSPCSLMPQNRASSKDREIYILAARTPHPTLRCQQCGELKLTTRGKQIKKGKCNGLRVLPRWFMYELLAKGVIVRKSSHRVCSECYEHLDASQFKRRYVKVSFLELSLHTESINLELSCTRSCTRSHMQET